MTDAQTIGENALEVISPDGSRRVVRISGSPFLIGRGEEAGNHLPLDDPRISRQCAAIISEPQGCVLEDLGYRRGIFVNGTKVDRRFLANGDVITFGLEQSYEIVFRSSKAETSVESMLTLIGGITGKNVPSSGLGKLNLLLEATSLLHSDLPLETVLGTMLDHAIAITQADRGLLLEAEDSGGLRIRLARGKGCVDLPTEGVAPSQTALRQATAQRSSVITEDLSNADTALQAAQSIVSQSLRAIVAIPLYSVTRGNSADSADQSGQGHFLGIVYLDSRRPTAFSKLDRQILDALGVEAASILDNARLVERERQRQRLEQELNIAREIQQALLPRGFRDFPYFAVTGLHTPCHAVGGDYFDVFPLSDDRTVVVVADVSGKGLGAALLTTMLQGAFSSMTTGTDPVQVLNNLNRFLCEHSEVGRYATLFFSILDRDGQISFVNAGHPSPLILRSGEVTELVSEGSFPVGLIPEAKFAAKTASLLPGDTLILFSDGVTEAMDPEEQLFGVSRLQEVLSGQQDTPLEDLQKKVLKSVETFTRGASQADDITVLLLRYRASALAASS
ncbi:MAG TPA: SpoIIE family protein phosphatase [Terriglobales bacterium]|nr:SpoIIE family protein phosphatase [Terriglobales bacterium]